MGPLPCRNLRDDLQGTSPQRPHLICKSCRQVYEVSIGANHKVIRSFPNFYALGGFEGFGVNDGKGIVPLVDHVDESPIRRSGRGIGLESSLNGFEHPIGGSVNNYYPLHRGNCNIHPFPIRAHPSMMALTTYVNCGNDFSGVHCHHAYRVVCRRSRFLLPLRVSAGQVGILPVRANSNTMRVHWTRDRPHHLFRRDVNHDKIV